MFTPRQKLKAVERELALRKRVYPGRVQRHRMTQVYADYEIAVMEAIALDFSRAMELHEKIMADLEDDELVEAVGLFHGIDQEKH